jgi:hypothetical protein
VGLNAQVGSSQNGSMIDRILPIGYCEASGSGLVESIQSKKGRALTGNVRM